MSDPVPVRNEFRLGLLITLLIFAVTVISIVQAVASSPWWLALPLTTYAILAAGLWWQDRRALQLAQIVDLPPANNVDLGLIDLHRWADAGDDPRWRCDLEDDTGEKR